MRPLYERAADYCASALLLVQMQDDRLGVPGCDVGAGRASRGSPPHMRPPRMRPPHVGSRGRLSLREAGRKRGGLAGGQRDDRIAAPGVLLVDRHQVGAR